MKISSNSIRTDLTRIEPSTTGETAFKAPANPKATSIQNQESATQLASSIKSETTLATGLLASKLNATFAQKINPKVVELKKQLEDLKQAKQGLQSQIVAAQGEIQGKELAGSSALERAQAQLQELQAQLAKVEIQIKSLMKQIEELRTQEEAEQNRAKQQEESNQSISDNLSKAAESLSQIRSAFDLDP